MRSFHIGFEADSYRDETGPEGQQYMWPTYRVSHVIEASNRAEAWREFMRRHALDVGLQMQDGVAYRFRDLENYIPFECCYFVSWFEEPPFIY